MVTGEDTYSQSTKEMYCSDIEDSLKQDTLYKNFEYFDDYTYGTSEKIGVYFRQHKSNADMVEIYFFQSDGPKEPDKLINLIRWRKSGLSDEVGHKGGGNKRNIYGFKSELTTIFVRRSDKTVLTCSVRPNKIYQLATSDINETQFRDVVDKNPYISWPESKNEEDLPAWYTKLYLKLYKESNIQPNYLLKMEIKKSDIPIEYKSIPHYEDYLNKLAAKQYQIPILFRNTILETREGEENNYGKGYHRYQKIDLIGWGAKQNIKQVLIHYDKSSNQFFIEFDNKYYPAVESVLDSKKKEFEHSPLPDTAVEWGQMEMFMVDNDYFDIQFKKINNSYNGCLQSFRVEDFYGIYLLLNNKLTNYLPVEGNLLGQSRNNNINEVMYNLYQSKSEEEQIELGMDKPNKCSGLFRMILKPNAEACLDTEIFNALIRTEIIKALSGFLSRSPYQEIIKMCMLIYRGRFPSVPKKVKDDKKIKNGGIYFVYLGYQLYKFGYVTSDKNFKKRLQELEKTSIEIVYEFTRKYMSYDHVNYIFTGSFPNPKAVEEKIAQMLLTDSSGKITVFQHEGKKNEIREYFKCTDIDYLIQEIIPEII